MPAAILSVSTAEKDFIGGPATLTLVIPAGTVPGDLLVANITTMSGIGRLIVLAGWTRIVQEIPSIGNPEHNLLHRTYQAGDPSSFVFSFTSAATAQGGMARVCGQALVNPIDTFNSGNNDNVNSPDLPMSIPSITTSEDDVLVIATTGSQPTGTLTPPSNFVNPPAFFTEHVDIRHTIRIAHISMHSRLFSNDGATGIVTVTKNGMTAFQRDGFAMVGIKGGPAGSGGNMGSPAVLPGVMETMETMERAEVPPGTRIKNPVRRIVDPWGELTRR